MNIYSDKDISKKINSKIIHNNLQFFVKNIKTINQVTKTSFIYFIEVESYRNKEECKHIAAEYQQRNEKTWVCIQCPKLDTFVKSLAFSKLSFKKAQVGP